MSMIVDRWRGRWPARATKALFDRLGYSVVPKWQQATETWGGLTRLPVRTVLDIGALRGEFAADVLAPAFPDATIHCFEPSPDAFPLLAGVAARSNGRIVAHNFGLGEEEAELKFFVNVDFQASSSFLAQTEANVEAFPQLERTEERVAKVRRLDDVAPGLGIRSDLVVKIDTQGYETHVIRGARETLRAAVGCIVEVQVAELYEGTSRFSDIYAELGALGFAFCGTFDQRLGRDGNVLYFDGLFIKHGVL